MHKATKKTANDQTQELCVYAVMPFVDCYCRNVTGSSIPNIAKYCMEENSGCPIYDKIGVEKTKQAGRGRKENINFSL